MKTSNPCQRLFHCFNPTPSNKHLLLAKVAPLLNGQQSSSQPRLQPRCQRRAFEREEGQRGPLEKTAPARGPTGDCEITSIELPPAESPQRTASSKTPFALPHPLRRPPKTTTTGDNMRSYEENTEQCFPHSKAHFTTLEHATHTSGLCFWARPSEPFQGNKVETLNVERYCSLDLFQYAFNKYEWPVF
jgi:hypothetical protein